MSQKSDPTKIFAELLETGARNCRRGAHGGWVGEQSRWGGGQDIFRIYDNPGGDPITTGER